jgi:hypothetical protein
MVGASTEGMSPMTAKTGVYAVASSCPTWISGSKFSTRTVKRVGMVGPDAKHRTIYRLNGLRNVLACFSRGHVALRRGRLQQAARGCLSTLSAGRTHLVFQESRLHREGVKLLGLRPAPDLSNLRQGFHVLIPSDWKRVSPDCRREFPIKGGGGTLADAFRGFMDRHPTIREAGAVS